MAARCALASTAPAEIVIRIFQSCDSFADLRSLLLTCRHIHAVWVANSPGIVGHVARKLIPAFDGAVIAVRNAPAHALASLSPLTAVMVCDTRRHALPPLFTLLSRMALSLQIFGPTTLPVGRGCSSPQSLRLSWIYTIWSGVWRSDIATTR